MSRIPKGAIMLKRITAAILLAMTLTTPTFAEEKNTVIRHGVAEFTRSDACKAEAESLKSTLRSGERGLEVRAAFLRRMADMNCDPGYLYGEDYPLNSSPHGYYIGVQEACVQCFLRVRFKNVLKLTPEHLAYEKAMFRFLKCGSYNQ